MRISLKEYTKFLREFYNTKPQPLRLGQAFWNKYLTHETQVEDQLFYEESQITSIYIIENNYVELY